MCTVFYKLNDFPTSPASISTLFYSKVIIRFRISIGQIKTWFINTGEPSFHPEPLQISVVHKINAERTESNTEKQATTIQHFSVGMKVYCIITSKNETVMFKGLWIARCVVHLFRTQHLGQWFIMPLVCNELIKIYICSYWFIFTNDMSLNLFICLWVQASCVHNWDYQCYLLLLLLILMLLYLLYLLMILVVTIQSIIV